MVLMSNEWISNDEDEQKSASASSTTADSTESSAHAADDENTTSMASNAINVQTPLTHVEGAISISATNPVTAATAASPAATAAGIFSSANYSDNATNVGNGAVTVIDAAAIENLNSDPQQLHQTIRKAMDLKQNTVDDVVEHVKEKHELETNETDTETELENEQDNNNLEYVNLLSAIGNDGSNSNTLIRAVTTLRSTMPPFTQQALDSALNSVMLPGCAISATAAGTATATVNPIVSAIPMANNSLFSTLGINIINGALQQQQQQQSDQSTLQQQQPLLQQQLISTAKTLGALEAQTNLVNNSGIGSNGGASAINNNNNNNHNNYTNNNLINNINNNNINISSKISSSSPIAPNTLFEHDEDARIALLCEPNSHPFQTRTLRLTPNIQCKVGRLIAKSKANEGNAIFDCKVLSRNHAVLWYTDDGKFWVKDTKSSNGTFINENKLGNDAAELHFGDIVKFGVDVLENSRKEVHGCIIACVKLYLPDGREAISIDSQAQRSQFSGEGRISFEEMHRLNSYIQEAEQRDKVIRNKMCSIQNVLDTTRKNSALCWQSLITEDQLLHKIHSLEKKLAIMEKNVPENVLRNEVLKLLDDKTSYQVTAKEALRKVYQERCDAMQMLSKMEAAYSTSDNECTILREQIMASKQSLQDVNGRLLLLETEYNEFKDEVERQQEEAKLREEQRIMELNQKLQQRENECEQLRNSIAILVKKSKSQSNVVTAIHTAMNVVAKDDSIETDDVKLQQQQAIDKLDAAIALMDDNSDDDDYDDDDDVDDDRDRVANATANIDKINKSAHIHNVDDNDDDNDDDEDDEIDVYAPEMKYKEAKKRIINAKKSANNSGVNGAIDKREKSKTFDDSGKDLKQKVVRKSTVMKWLQNSDLNKGENSLDMFKAIFNEDSESDDSDSIASPPQSLQAVGAIGAGAKKTALAGSEIATSSAFVNDKAFQQKCSEFTSKLQNVQMNLQQLEAEIASETNKAEDIIATLSDGSSADDVLATTAATTANDNKNDSKLKASKDSHSITEESKRVSKKRQDRSGVVSKDNKSYQLLKSSVDILREAYNEICMQQTTEQKTIDNTEPQHMKSPSNTPTKTATPTGANKKLITQETHITTSDAAHMSALTHDHSPARRYNNEQTVEMLQIECDDWRDKVGEMARVIETLRGEKAALEHVINENKPNIKRVTAGGNVSGDTAAATNSSQKDSNGIDSKSQEIYYELAPEHLTKDHTGIEDNDAFEAQIRAELSALNNSQVEREEELIVYKERLEQSENSNLQLRNEITQLKTKAPYNAHLIIRQALPIGALAIAAIVYFLTSRF